jgi:hypothetical protein
MSELEQIAKQVSLLNRLIELLLVRNKSEGLFPLDITKDDGKTWIKYTEKAWSDELVKVARELNNLPTYRKWTVYYLDEICELLHGTFEIHLDTQNSSYEEKVALHLEAILNRYGRSSQRYE